MTSNTKKQSLKSPKRVINPQDPVWSSIEEMTVGLSPKERFEVLDRIANPKQQESYDLNNLPFDPAIEAMKDAQRYMEKNSPSEKPFDLIEDESDESYIRSGNPHLWQALVQNFQFAAQAKGFNLGPLSATNILEMADKGELKGLEDAVGVVRDWVSKFDK